MAIATPIVPKIQSLAKRLESARALVEAGAVVPASRADFFTVLSSTQGSYLVSSGWLDQEPKCACPDFQYRGQQLDGWCKHRLAVELYVERQPVTPAPRALSATEREQLERDLADLC